METLTSAPRRNERGQAVIEMALTLPLLLLVVFGIIDFGFMFQRYEVVTNAAREGARLGVLPEYSKAEAESRAIAYLEAAGMTGNKVTCSDTRVEKARDMCALLTGPTTVTVAGSTPPRTVDQITMLVEYDHEHSFVGPILRLFGTTWGTIRLSATSTMRKE